MRTTQSLLDGFFEAFWKRILYRVLWWSSTFIKFLLNQKWNHLGFTINTFISPSVRNGAKSNYSEKFWSPSFSSSSALHVIISFSCKKLMTLTQNFGAISKRTHTLLGPFQQSIARIDGKAEWNTTRWISQNTQRHPELSLAVFLRHGIKCVIQWRIGWNDLIIAWRKKQADVSSITPSMRET